MEMHTRSEQLREVLEGPNRDATYKQLNKSATAGGGYSRVDPGWSEEDYLHDRFVALLEDGRPPVRSLPTHIAVSVSNLVKDNARSRKVRNLDGHHVEDVNDQEAIAATDQLNLGLHRQALSRATADWLPRALPECSRVECEALLEWFKNDAEFPADWPAGGAKRKALGRAFERLARCDSTELCELWNTHREQV